MNKEEKENLRKLDKDNLAQRLEELNNQKFKLEVDMYKGTNRNYPVMRQHKPYGNLKNIKKAIAFVNMLLTKT